MEPTLIPEFPSREDVGVHLVPAREQTEEAVAACPQQVGSVQGLMSIAQDRAHLLGRPPDPLHAVGAAGIAVALTTLTHLDRARDLQARDEKELVGTTITRRGVAVASIVMTAEVDLAVKDAVPGSCHKQRVLN